MVTFLAVFPLTVKIHHDFCVDFTIHAVRLSYILS